MPQGGCKNPSPVEWVKGVVSETCPITYGEEFSLVMLASVENKKGRLPHAGGWADQPAKLMELMRIYEYSQ